MKRRLWSSDLTVSQLAVGTYYKLTAAATTGLFCDCVYRVRGFTGKPDNPVAIIEIVKNCGVVGKHDPDDPRVGKVFRFFANHIRCRPLPLTNALERLDEDV